MTTYRTFIRSAKNFEEYASNPKIPDQSDLTLNEALDICGEYNANRTAAEIAAGTVMEFERE